MPFRKPWPRARSRPCAAAGRGERDQGPQPMHRRVEQGAQDARPRDFELAPQLVLRTPLRSPIGARVRKIARSAKIRPADDILDAVQEDRARGLKQHLLVVGVELPYGESRRRSPVGRGRRKAKRASPTDCRMRAGGRCWRQSSARVPRAERPDRRGIGIDQCLEQL